MFFCYLPTLAVWKDWYCSSSGDSNLANSVSMLSTTLPADAPVSDFCARAVNSTNTRSCGKISCSSDEKYCSRMLPRKSPHQPWLPHSLTNKAPAWICILRVLLIHRWVNTASQSCGVNVAYTFSGTWGIVGEGSDMLSSVSNRYSHSTRSLSVEACLSMILIPASVSPSWLTSCSGVHITDSSLSIALRAKFSWSCNSMQSW